MGATAVFPLELLAADSERDRRPDVVAREEDDPAAARAAYDPILAK